MACGGTPLTLARGSRCCSPPCSLRVRARWRRIWRAAALWRFDGVEPGALDVTVPRARRPQAVPGVVHRSRDLDPADVEPHAAIPRTSATRTFLDIAPLLEPRQLEAVLDGAERDGTIWRPRLRWRIGRMRHERQAARPGLTAVEALLDRTEGRPLGDTWLEQEAIRIIAAARLPIPRVQVHWRKHGGGTARVDLWWDDATLIVELAGHGSHATRRQRQSDDERAARLGLCGWQIVEFTYEDVVERPGYFARDDRPPPRASSRYPWAGRARQRRHRPTLSDRPGRARGEPDPARHTLRR
jgi:hypothetical protein